MCIMLTLISHTEYIILLSDTILIYHESIANFENSDNNKIFADINPTDNLIYDIDNVDSYILLPYIDNINNLISDILTMINLKTCFYLRSVVSAS